MVELSGGSTQRPPSLPPSLHWETKESFSRRSTVTWEAAVNVGHVSGLLLRLSASPPTACANLHDYTDRNLLIRCSSFESFKKVQLRGVGLLLKRPAEAFEDCFTCCAVGANTTRSITVGLNLPTGPMHSRVKVWIITLLPERM